MPTELVDAHGWMCSAGGTGPYLSLKARLPQLRTFIREELGDHRFYALDHAAVRARRLVEIRADLGSHKCAMSYASVRTTYQEIPMS